MWVWVVPRDPPPYPEWVTPDPSWVGVGQTLPPLRASKEACTELCRRLAILSSAHADHRNGLLCAWRVSRLGGGLFGPNLKREKEREREIGREREGEGEGDRE